MTAGGPAPVDGRGDAVDRAPAEAADARSGPRDLASLYREVLLESLDASPDPVYVISVAAQLVGVHAQTLRHYERLGLIVPARSGGGIRLYSARDVTRLRAIVRLTEELGLNLAGVEVLLNLHQRINALEGEVDALRAELRMMRGYLLEDRGGRG
jgi:MerR family transcriptional regulator, heat shock protein HspR